MEASYKDIMDAIETQYSYISVSLYPLSVYNYIYG